MRFRGVDILVGMAYAATAALGMRRIRAHLAVGATAPGFTLQAAKGGVVETIELQTALAHGPVVLYFYPKSFSSGCTVEAYLFSERAAEFDYLDATLIGVSGDDIATQSAFSTQECGSAFWVASDPDLRVAKEYDAALVVGFANRVSYVIARDGTIVASLQSFDPAAHVATTLEALREIAPKPPWANPSANA
jgi:peroxiredoxin Q/BCP